MRRCCVKISWVLKHLPHSWHLNGLYLVWTFKWRNSFCLWTNVFWHPCHSQMYELKPFGTWTSSICSFKSLEELKTSLQLRHLHTWSWDSSCNCLWALACLATVLLSKILTSKLIPCLPLTWLTMQHGSEVLKSQSNHLQESISGSCKVTWSFKTCVWRSSRFSYGCVQSSHWHWIGALFVLNDQLKFIVFAARWELESVLTSRDGPILCW